MANVTFAFANGGSRPKMITTGRNGLKKTFCPSGGKLKREGVKKGLPDVGMFWPNSESHGLFIEFKSKNGRLSIEQSDIIALLKNKGYTCVVCHSLEEAIDETVRYLGV